MQPLDAIRETGVVAIVRHVPADRIGPLARALQAGGVRAIEVTLNTEGALEAIARLAAERPADVAIGAGTVMTAGEVASAVGAGATFIVCPHTDDEVIAAARERGVPVIPGAYTPSEIVRAWRAGAAMVKLFPASNGGPKYLREVRAPLADIPIVPTGGVGLDTAADFVRAGAVAIGLGSALTPRDRIAAGDWQAITDLAARFVAAVREGRAGSSRA
ncbi:MAG TPA: bifunctional 4-hydroxy-2-oxoglutarate aldolase/2-dehydro-3-deoxy-phosphogluconate aldolase [Thermodesulfobacteriota bacterium]